MKVNTGLTVGLKRPVIYCPHHSGDSSSSAVCWVLTLPLIDFGLFVIECLPWSVNHTHLPIYMGNKDPEITCPHISKYLA